MGEQRSLGRSSVGQLESVIRASLLWFDTGDASCIGSQNYKGYLKGNIW